MVLEVAKAGVEMFDRIRFQDWLEVKLDGRLAKLEFSPEQASSIFQILQLPFTSNIAPKPHIDEERTNDKFVDDLLIKLLESDANSFLMQERLADLIIIPPQHFGNDAVYLPAYIFVFIFGEKCRVHLFYCLQCQYLSAQS
jgi:hypothetical protein